MAKLQKADFHIEINDRMKKETALLIERLQKDPAVLSLFEKNQLPPDLIQKKPWTIEAWRKAYMPCLGCSGLTSCHQKMQGYYPDLTYDGVVQNVFAPCRYKRRQQENRRHLDNYRINDLPSSLSEVSFASIRPEGETTEYLRLTAVLMEASRHNTGIYLYGTMGSGKTYLAACAANEHARRGNTVSFVHYPSFVQRLSAAIMDGEYKQELQRAVYCDFLVLDDIGAESVTEWNRDSILLPLLNYRYENNLPVWFTSNCDPETLQIHYAFVKDREDQMKSKRIMERIEHMAQTQALTGKDRRKNIANSFH